MIMSSGLGFLVAAMTFGSCLLANFGWMLNSVMSTTRLIPGDRFSALVVGGIISSCVGFILRGRSDRFVVGEETGERLVINNSSHSFFFIPMHWAGIVIAVIGIGAAISEAF